LLWLLVWDGLVRGALGGCVHRGGGEWADGCFSGPALAEGDSWKKTLLKGKEEDGIALSRVADSWIVSNLGPRCLGSYLESCYDAKGLGTDMYE